MRPMGDTNPKWRQIVGWMAVSISVAVACFWAFWGSIENFHEGWYYTSLWQNLVLMIVQYLGPMLIVMAISLVVVRWPLLAIPLLGGSAIALGWFFRRSPAGIELIVIPLAILGVLYHFGRPQPRRSRFREACVPL